MRILGLDWGSSSIKAVEVDSAFGRFEVHEYHEEKIQPGEAPSDSVGRLLNSLAKRPDKVAVSVRTAQSTFRNLRLPTRDKRAIEAGVRFELEDDLPFPIEDAAYDYSILSQAKQASALHASAALKSVLGTALTNWSATGVDPDLISTEAWAYKTFFNRVLAPELKGKPVMLVQIGHQRTVIYVHFEDSPIIAREIAWGGNDLTTAICQKYGVPLDQAEHAKLDHGFVIPRGQVGDASAEQVEFSETLIEPLQLLMSDIRQAELTCKTLTNHAVELIYVSGGTSLLPGLPRVLEEVLRVPVKYLQSLTSLATSGVAYNEETDSKFLLAASLALCLVGDKRSSAINFRKGSFGKNARSREFNVATLKMPLIALGAILLCFFLSVLIQAQVYQSRLKDTNVALEKSVRAFFGQLSGSAVKTYLSNTTTLKASINKELQKQRDLAKLVSPNPHNPLGFLLSLSNAVPRDIVTDLTQFSVGAAPSASFLDPKADLIGTTSLTFVFKDQSTADSLAGKLTSKITGLEKSKVEEAMTPFGEKGWKVTFKGKPTEDAYGK